MVATVSPLSPLSPPPVLTAAPPLFLLLRTIAACQVAESVAPLMRVEEGLTEGWQSLEERWRGGTDRESKTEEGEEGNDVLMGKRMETKAEMMREEKRGKLQRNEHGSERERSTGNLNKAVTQAGKENGGRDENQSRNEREEKEENERRDADHDTNLDEVSYGAEEEAEEESNSGLILFSAFHRRTKREVRRSGDAGQCGAGGRGHIYPNITSAVVLRRNGGALLHPGNGGDFGKWGKYEMCERGTYAYAFQLRVEEPLGIIWDDTALNSVRLYCRAPTSQASAGSVTSGYCWGAWGEPRACEPGAFLWGLRLWVEEPQGPLDDVGATDLDMVCQDGSALNGGGVCWGQDSEWLTCPHGYVICGLRTRVESNAGVMGDNTALNDLMMMCCELH
ncbi:uncharacterized protein LOC126986767 [Eriocheir sinensis]|uniref:uncharacterized protein LOC126986767 n=1 Tax=Eriocheir sinensis TaxID=95602 RepID=UPI0021C70044|nr:uncharacterized protein LOC126986767 [Eriocheir sinensis]